MRFLLLITLLTSFAFSALPVDSLRLAGSKAWQTVTINHLAVGETATHFLFQKKIPRIGLVAANVDSANDVGITRINDTTRIPRWVVFATDTIYIYADIAVSSTIDTSYRLHYGVSLNETNASATFTNNNITGYMAGNEKSGSTLADYATGGSYTPSPSGIINGAGIFGSGLTFSASGTDNIPIGNQAWLQGAANLTLCFNIRQTNTSAVRNIFARGTGVTNFLVLQTVSGSSNFTIYLCNGSLASGVFTNTTANTDYINISVTYNGAGATNADRLKFYVNGAAKTATFAGTIPATTSSDVLSTYIGNTTGSFLGSMDELCMTNSTSTAGGVTSRYNQLFNAATFSTISNEVQAPTGSRWSAYKSAYRSAFKPAYR